MINEWFIINDKPELQDHHIYIHLDIYIYIYLQSAERRDL